MKLTTCAATSGLLYLATLFTLGSNTALAQPRVFSLGDGPWYYTTYEQNTQIKVSVVTRGLSHPWSMVFLPGTESAANPLGDALISENAGSVRLLRNGILLSAPAADLAPLSPDIVFDLTLHPDYSSNHLVYLTYLKQGPRPDGSEGYWATTALARGRFDGNRLADLEDIFVADAWAESRGGYSVRVTFAPDGTLLLSSSHRLDPDSPQNLETDIGKILRLNADGTVPANNPFIGRDDVKPEIFSYGHRTVMDMVVHPQTGEIWETENGPQGGDEVNILQIGANFGWPLATYGREYDGRRASDTPVLDTIRPPELFWVPSITVSSLMFYTGDKFPAWQNNLFVSSMIQGRIPGTGHLERIVFNENGEQRREQLLNELRQRIRFVGQGPDGLLYLLTDENDGVLLRIEPASATEVASAVPVSAATVQIAATQPGQLFPQQDCAACHQTEVATVGPSFRDLARKYTATDTDMLVGKIIEGGAGNWGDIPMTPHPALSKEQAAVMVSTILAL